MFRGISTVNVDAKGRMAIPTRYRAILEDQDESYLVVTIDTEERCLLMYPLSEWEVIERRIEALPSFNKVTRRIQRLLIGHATEVEIDSQGRILLPALLRTHAGLQKRIKLVGQGKKFEIWSETHWQGQCIEWMKASCDEGEGVPEILETLSV